MVVIGGQKPVIAKCAMHDWLQHKAAKGHRRERSTETTNKRATKKRPLPS
jgi:hypothetical protein